MPEKRFQPGEIIGKLLHADAPLLCSAKISAQSRCQPFQAVFKMQGDVCPDEGGLPPATGTLAAPAGPWVR